MCPSGIFRGGVPIEVLEHMRTFLPRGPGVPIVYISRYEPDMMALRNMWTCISVHGHLSISVIAPLCVTPRRARWLAWHIGCVLATHRHIGYLSSLVLCGFRIEGSFLSFVQGLCPARSLSRVRRLGVATQGVPFGDVYALLRCMPGLRSLDLSRCWCSFGPGRPPSHRPRSSGFSPLHLPQLEWLSTSFNHDGPCAAEQRAMMGDMVRVATANAKTITWSVRYSGLVTWKVFLLGRKARAAPPFQQLHVVLEDRQGNARQGRCPYNYRLLHNVAFLSLDVRSLRPLWRQCAVVCALRAQRVGNWRILFSTSANDAIQYTADAEGVIREDPL